MTNDENAIRATLTALNQAWLQGNGTAFAACLTEDADYVVFDGSRLRGRAANAALHDTLFKTVLRGTQLEGELESIAFLTPEVALVHGVGGVLWPWQKTPSASARSRQTTVLVRQDGRWLVRAFHNTRIRRPRPLPPPGSLAVRFFHLFVRLRTRLAA